MKNIIYDRSEHVHRFAIWTAARAAQRGFASTAVIKDLIEQSDLRDFAERTTKNQKWSQKDYDDWHRDTCKLIINAYNFYVSELPEELVKFDSKKKPSKKPPAITFGRAAKIVAVYLKTAVTLARLEHFAFKVIHPPIDSILLKNLPFSLLPEIKENRAWTKWNEEQYYQTWKFLKHHDRAKENWMLEEYWKV